MPRPAVVTGASSGIGQATALALAAAGHPVVLGARRVERCEETAAAIRAAGGQAVAVPLDLRDTESIVTFASAATAAVGPVEVVVSGAGNILASSAVATTPDQFGAEVELNLLGAHRLVSAIVPGMIERRTGDVVFVSSDVLRWPRPQAASYVASKWGLEGLARAMQMELEGTGVRASIVRPGPTLTGMGMDWEPERVDELLTEWRRWGLVRHDGYLSAEAVARVVVMVVSIPPGTHLTLVEIEPEAPVLERGAS